MAKSIVTEYEDISAFSGAQAECKHHLIFGRGLREFSTQEFSHLLDLLIQDAEALGIETLTPAELARMRAYEQEKEDARKDEGKSDTQGR